MGVMIEEQETTISIYRDGETAEIYTSDSTMMTKLDKRVRENPESWRCVRVETMGDGAEIVAKWYECPKRLISFRSAILHTNRPGNGEALKRWREAQKGADEDTL